MNSGLLTNIGNHLDALQAGIGVPAGLSDINNAENSDNVARVGRTRLRYAV